MIRIVLVEDQTLVRHGIRSLIATTGDIEVAAEAADGQEALERIPLHKPDCVLLDIRLPKISGIEVLRRLARVMPLPPTILLTTFDDDEALLQGIRAGAKGYRGRKRLSPQGCFDRSARRFHSAGGRRRDTDPSRDHRARNPCPQRCRFILRSPRPSRPVDEAGSRNTSHDGGRVQ